MAIESPNKPMPFHDIDIEGLAYIVGETPLILRLFLNYDVVEVASTLRRLWLARETVLGLLQSAERLYQAEKEVHRQTREMMAEIGYRLENAEEDAHREFPLGSSPPKVIVMSPLQWQKMVQAIARDNLSSPANLPIAPGSTWKDLEIYTARGISGPLVMTQEAFNAMARGAPELELRRV